MMENGLLQRLEEKGWEAKYERYSKYFEYGIVKNKVINPRVSIVIVAWKYHELILQCLIKLREQINNDSEIIFVNNGADESVFTALEPYMDIYVRLNANTGAYLSRNVGSIFASSEILLFHEDDGIPDKDLVRAHISLYEKYDIITARGRVEPITSGSENPCHYAPSPVMCPMYCEFEGNVTYKSEIFYLLGGWDDDILMGHGGIELSLKMLYKYPLHRLQIYSPLPLIYHDYTKEPSRHKRKMELQAQSLQRLRKIHPDWDDFFSSWVLHRHDDIVVKNPFMNIIYKMRWTKIKRYITLIIKPIVPCRLWSFMIYIISDRRNSFGGEIT